MIGLFRFAALLSITGIASGCTSVSSNYNARVADVSNQTLTVCHGFDCRNQTALPISAFDHDRLEGHFQDVTSPQAERAAISRAVQQFEEMSTARLGVADKAKSGLSQTGQHGQMDCIDESTNTRTLLRYLEANGLLRHHSVEMNVTRGVLFDGRYFHATAVIREASGARWAIDSWYEAAGGAPDIMPLKVWLRRGVGGER